MKIKVNARKQKENSAQESHSHQIAHFHVFCLIFQKRKLAEMAKNSYYII